MVETPDFVKRVQAREYRGVYQKIRTYVYPQLRMNPFFGPSRKKLRGEFAGVYRYRVGGSRLFSLVRQEQVLVVVVAIEKRKDAYR